eukprot:COSAG02_NODE_5210_length_4540_cov_2.660662_2_plen_170_part_00
MYRITRSLEAQLFRHLRRRGRRAGERARARMQLARAASLPVALRVGTSSEPPDSLQTSLRPKGTPTSVAAPGRARVTATIAEPPALMGAEERFASVAIALGVSLAASRCCRRTLVSSAAAVASPAQSASSSRLKVMLPVDTVSNLPRGMAGNGVVDSVAQHHWTAGFTN